MGRIYLIPSIVRTDLDDVIELIRTKCDLHQPEDGTKPDVITTGAGCNLFRKRLENGLNIRCKFYQNMCWAVLWKRTHSYWYFIRVDFWCCSVREKCAWCNIVVQINSNLFSCISYCAVCAVVDDFPSKFLFVRNFVFSSQPSSKRVGFFQDFVHITTVVVLCKDWN